jgi:hypothetical protein
MEDNRAAGDIIPPLPKVNSLQALMRLRPKKTHKFCVFAFVLNKDMINKDGSLDDFYGYVFPLGSFDDKHKAEEHAKNIIAITGHPAVVSSKYATPVPLSSKFDPKTVTEVPVDIKGRLIKLESEQYKQEKEYYETRVKKERELLEEAEEETNLDSIEHFKRQCYLAIKNRAAYIHSKKEADNAWDNYKKREAAVRDHYAQHPEHEADWLPYLKDKLTERGELPLYSSLEAAYKELRPELLGLDVNKDAEDANECSDGVCILDTARVSFDEEIISADDVKILPEGSSPGFIEESDSDEMSEKLNILTETPVKSIKVDRNNRG